jgi:predicted GNAT family acetyltransferase
MKVEINLAPNDNHLSEIKSWLVEEENKTGQGFFCNWDSIIYAFDRKELTIITKDDLVIGFLAYSITDCVVHIEITEIHPRFRKKGFGKTLVSESLKAFKEKGNVTVELYCQPIESERVWRKLGFTRFQISQHDSKINMYKLLIEALNVADCKENEEVIELLGEEYHKAGNKSSKWTWKVKGHKLDKPIIIPAFYDWEICWRKGNEIYKEGKVKNFYRKQIIYGNFMIIRKLSLKAI